MSLLVGLVACNGLLNLDRFRSGSADGGAGGSGGAGGAPDCALGCVLDVQLYGGDRDDEGRVLLRTVNGEDGKDRLTLFAHYQSAFAWPGFDALVPSSNEDLLLTRITPTGFAADWVGAFPAPNEENAQAVAHDGGASYICGGFLETLTIGDTTLTAPASRRRGFVARIDDDGTVRWAVPIPSSGSGRCNAIAANERGVFIGGSFEGMLELMTPVSPAMGGTTDAYLAHLDKNTGMPIWNEVFGNQAFDIVASLAVTDDALFIGARYQGEITLTNQTIGGTMVPNEGNSFVAAMDYDSRDLFWHWTIDGPGNQAMEQIAVGPNGGVHAVGFFEDSINLEGQSITTVGIDGFYVRLGTNGNLETRAIFTGAGDTRAHAVAVDPSTGEIAAGLRFEDEVGIDNSFTRDAFRTPPDAAVARLTPNGEHMALHILGSDMTDICWGVAFDAQGSIVATGQIGPNPRVDAQVVDQGNGALDIFLARFGRPTMAP